MSKPSRQGGGGVNPYSVVAAGILGAMGAFLAVGLVDGRNDLGAAFTPSTVHRASVIAWQGWSRIVLDPYYWGFLAVLFVLQWLFPARPDQRGLSVGLGADMMWFLGFNALSVTIVAAYLAALDLAYRHLLGDWALHLPLDTVALSILAFVVTDLLAWGTHLLHHKVPVLWSFHAVHHSQEHLNGLSDNREHVGETIVAATLVFVPSRLLGLDAPAAAGLAFLMIFVNAFIHANIRTSLGPLRYLFISPQAHRVHHSAAPQHIDTNFGTVFAWWDYLFGTRYRDHHDYPSTGIHDPGFPREDPERPWAVPGAWVRQMAYPVRTLFGRRARALSATARTAPVPTRSPCAHDRWRPPPRGSPPHPPRPGPRRPRVRSKVARSRTRPRRRAGPKGRTGGGPWRDRLAYSNSVPPQQGVRQLGVPPPGLVQLLTLDPVVGYDPSS